jgi:hypothetical protein
VLIVDGVFKKKPRSGPSTDGSSPYLGEGDTLVVTRADRVARSAAKFSPVQGLKKKGVALKYACARGGVGPLVGFP